MASVSCVELISLTLGDAKPGKKSWSFELLANGLESFEFVLPFGCHKEEKREEKRKETPTGNREKLREESLVSGRDKRLARLGREPNSRPISRLGAAIVKIPTIFQTISRDPRVGQTCRTFDHLDHWMLVS